MSVAANYANDAKGHQGFFAFPLPVIGVIRGNHPTRNPKFLFLSRDLLQLLKKH